MTRTLTLSLVLSLVALSAWAQDYGSGIPMVNVQPAAGAGGDVATNFTLDVACQGAWLIYSTGDSGESDAEANQCNGSLPTVFTGSTFSGTGTAPAGSASGQDAVILNGTDQYFVISDPSELEVNNFTWACWANPDASGGGNQNLMDHGVGANYEYFLSTSLDGRAKVNSTQSNLSTRLIAGDWAHIAMRYDGDGTETDATENAIEVFYNGLIDCDGACETDINGVAGNNFDFGLGAEVQGGVELWFDGNMMECVFFSKVLDDEEMAELFLCGADGSADGSSRDTTFGGAQCSDTGAGKCCS